MAEKPENLHPETLVLLVDVMFYVAKQLNLTPQELLPLMKAILCEDWCKEYWKIYKDKAHDGTE